MRAWMPPAKAILASSQRRSAAALFHSSVLQCALGKRFRMSASLAPMATPFASNAAAAGLDTARRRMARSIRRIQFPPAKTVFLMVVHHAHRLHEGVHDSRTDEIAAALAQVLRHCLGRRLGLARGETPDIAREAAELLPQRDDRAGVDDQRVDLGAVAYDARIGQQLLLFLRVVA